MNPFFIFLCVPALVLQGWLWTSFAVAAYRMAFGVAIDAGWWVWWLLVPAAAGNVLWIVWALVAMWQKSDKGREWQGWVIACGFLLKGIALLAFFGIHIGYFFAGLPWTDFFNSGFLLGNWIAELALAVIFFYFAIVASDELSGLNWRERQLRDRGLLG